MILLFQNSSLKIYREIILFRALVSVCQHCSGEDLKNQSVDLFRQVPNSTFLPFS
jgi:hypothetical protein